MTGFKEIGQNGKKKKNLKNLIISLPYYTYEAATLCKKLEKSYERILRSSSEERADESEFIGLFAYVLCA